MEGSIRNHRDVIAMRQNDLKEFVIPVEFDTDKRPFPSLRNWGRQPASLSPITTAAFLIYPWDTKARSYAHRDKQIKPTNSPSIPTCLVT